MPRNTDPIFVGRADFDWDTAGALTTANTAKDGTGTVQILWTAESEGSYLEKVICCARGTNVASVLRLWVNNGGATTTAANNKLLTEVSLPATTLSEVAAQPDVAKLLDLKLPATYRIIAAIGTTVAAGWDVSISGGHFTPVGTA
jgi:hypothetical protein